MLGFLSIAYGQPSSAIRIAGTAFSAETGLPLEGASIKVTGRGGVLPKTPDTQTDAEGKFALYTSLKEGVIQVSYIGYQTQMIQFSPTATLLFTIRMVKDDNTLEEVEINTGYQQLPKERATGSFDHIGEELINRSITTNVLDRLENLTPGISFRNANDGLLVRGRSSIHSNVNPLIILDNFPYDGELENINPNDISGITVLKDAAAASIWGARAGNGVIVITTKRGRSAKPQVSLNTNTTLAGKPDILRTPVISSADYIDLEKFLFKNGYYDYDEQLNSIGYGAPPFTPVVELLIAQRDGLIDSVAAFSQIDAYKRNDVRQDLREYFYRTGVNQQHALNVSGETPHLNYFLSTGWDYNKDNDRGGTILNRITLRSRNVYNITSFLKAETGLNFTQYNSINGNMVNSVNSGGAKGLYPYADLVDDQGNALVLVRDNRLSYVDTAGGGQLLDWKYRPLDEMRTSALGPQRRDYVINAAVTATLWKGLDAEFRYQYQHQGAHAANNASLESYDTRNLINRYTQPTSPTFTRPIPLGDVVNYSDLSTHSHQGRAMLSYRNSWERHEWNAVAGWEIKERTDKSSIHRNYGYQRDGSRVAGALDYQTSFAMYNNRYTTASISMTNMISEKLDRFISSFANASYTFDQRYTVSGSIREDAANLFGVSTNQRGVPLWSAGAAWQLHRESFMDAEWIGNLKLRLTYGRSGNISRQVSAYSTIAYVNNALISALPAATVTNPPNSELRWEQVGMLNMGVDFSLFGNRLSGTVEGYRKTSKDLMAQAPVDATLGLINLAGVNTFYGNVASMKGGGWDVQLNGGILRGAFSWDMHLQYSYALMNVSEYLMPVSQQGQTYVSNPSFVNPVIGKPVFTLYGYRWAGLNPEDGAPQGYLDGEVHTDYAKIIGNTPLDSLVYGGPQQPPHFGAWRNHFSYKNWSLSFNISYKMGYSFKRNSVSYSNLFSDWTGHSDYSKRWQKPGDEQWTDVPSMVYPAVSQRETFYRNSAALITTGDHIRLEDISLQYRLSRAVWAKLPVEQCTLALYASNLGILWQANKQGVDPYFQNGLLPGKQIAVSLNVSL